jgi:hydroxyacylglutathione hydrolase
MLNITPLPIFDDNYVWVIRNGESNNVAVVDPGDSVAVAAYLESHSLNLVSIFITHHHDDHIGGVQALIEIYKPEVIGPSHSSIIGLTSTVWEGDSVELFGSPVRVLSSQGHTLDHVMYLVNDEDSDSDHLFCGDTLFSAGCGRLFEGTAKQMFDSFEKIKNLSMDTFLYPTHEYSMSNLLFAKEVEPNNLDVLETISKYKNKRSLGEPTLPTQLCLEVLINPFLRVDQTAVINSAVSFTKKSALSGSDVFGAIRLWKDSF